MLTQRTLEVIRELREGGSSGSFRWRKGTAADLPRVLSAPVIGLDVETRTRGREPDEMRDGLVGVSIALDFGDCVYFDDTALLRGLTLPPFYGHNAKYDAMVLRRHGVFASCCGDSRVAAYLLGQPEAALKPLVFRRYGYRLRTLDEVLAGRSIDDVPAEELGAYCAEDARWALRMGRDMEQELERMGLIGVYRLEVAMIDLLVDMQALGIAVDREAMQREVEAVERKMRGLSRGVQTLAARAGFERSRQMVCPSCRNGSRKRLSCEDCGGQGRITVPLPVNPASGDQMETLLFDILGLPFYSLTGTGRRALDGLTLLRLRKHPVAELVLRYRALQKYAGFLRSWLVASEEDGCVHTTLTNTKVVSGRLSSRNPNLQQVKGPWRRFFVSR